MLELAYWLVGGFTLLLLEYSPDSDGLGDVSNQPPELDVQSQAQEAGETKWWVEQSKREAERATDSCMIKVVYNRGSGGCQDT